MPKKKIIKKNSFIISFVISITSGLVLQIGLISLFASFIVKFDPNPDLYKYSWFIILSIPCIISSAIIAKLRKTKGYLWGLIVSLILLIVQFTIILLICSFQIESIILIAFPVALILGILSGIITTNIN